MVALSSFGKATTSLSLSWTKPSFHFTLFFVDVFFVEAPPIATFRSFLSSNSLFVSSCFSSSSSLAKRSLSLTDVDVGGTSSETVFKFTLLTLSFVARECATRRVFCPRRLFQKQVFLQGSHLLVKFYFIKFKFSLQMKMLGMASQGLQKQNKIRGISIHMHPRVFFIA